MRTDLITPIVDEGLGNSTYLVDLGDGRALSIDPSIDLRAVDAAAARRGLTVAFAAETHLHADFVSGATRLHARDGAAIVGSALGGREFDHVGLRDEDVVDLGGLSLRAWSTPGHTPEHLTYLLEDDGRVLAVFTGGSLIVGAAARTDLVGPDRTEELARAQFRSLRRLAALPADTPVLPTHGAGSFCSAPPGADRTTTIGRELETNALLRLDDEDAFVDALLDQLGTFPTYFLRLAEVNRRGPGVPGASHLSGLTVEETLAWRTRGAEIVDVRPVEDYAAGHVPGSLAIALRPVFATWLGWLLPDSSTPLVIVRNDDQDPEEVVWQARKVGYDAVVGELAGGFAAWRDAGRAVETVGLVAPADAATRTLLDGRQDSEHAAGHVPGARHVELGALPDTDAAELPTDVVVMCGHSERATTAASVLERRGRQDVSVLVGGPGDVVEATGSSLTEGSHR